MNIIFLIGNLGSDPEIRYTSAGQAVANVGLATEERWKDKEGTQKKETTWHNLVAWGRLAEILRDYTHKGNKIAVVGRAGIHEWTDMNTAEIKRKPIVTVTQIELLTPRSDRPEDQRPANTGTDADLAVPDQFTGGPQGDGLPF